MHVARQAQRGHRTGRNVEAAELGAGIEVTLQRALTALPDATQRIHAVDRLQHRAFGIDAGRAVQRVDGVHRVVHDVRIAAEAGRAACRTAVVAEARVLRPEDEGVVQAVDHLALALFGHVHFVGRLLGAHIRQAEVQHVPAQRQVAGEHVAVRRSGGLQRGAPRQERAAGAARAVVAPGVVQRGDHLGQHVVVLEVQFALAQRQARPLHPGVQVVPDGPGHGLVQVDRGRHRLLVGRHALDQVRGAILVLLRVKGCGDTAQPVNARLSSTTCAGPSSQIGQCAGCRHQFPSSSIPFQFPSLLRVCRNSGVDCRACGIFF